MFQEPSVGKTPLESDSVDRNLLNFCRYTAERFFTYGGRVRMNLKAQMMILLIAAPVAAENDFTHSGLFVQGQAMQLISAFVAPPGVPSDLSPSGLGFAAGIGYRLLRSDD